MVAPARKAQSKNCPLVNCPNETMPAKTLAGKAECPEAEGVRGRRVLCQPLGKLAKWQRLL